MGIDVDILALVVWLTSLLATIYSTWLVLRYFDMPYPDPQFLPPLSILKPIVGYDSGLEKNIESFFQLSYPCFELLFSFQENCAGKQIVERLQSQYPHIKSKIFVTNEKVGLNPKINNIYRSYQEASYDLILISDSSIRVKPDYLQGMVLHLDSGGVGVVTSVVVGKNAKTLGGRLEAMYLNTFYVRGMILAHTLNQPCVVGKSMLVQKSIMSQLGGLKALSKYLAEDYMTGKEVKRLQYDLEISHEPVEQHIGKYSAKDFWSRHVRWGRIRKSHVPIAFFVEPVLSCSVSALIGSYVVPHFLPVAWWVVFCSHIFIWAFCDALVLKTVKDELSVSKAVVWAMREMISFPLWIHTALGNTVQWRGKRYRIKRGKIVTL